ncbi:MAG TPA: hypothetical protein PLY70_07815, partial [Saprospiraceae bacterium]|nr:hypothetical protein [Saprospiraceae bacterium]
QLIADDPIEQLQARISGDQILHLEIANLPATSPDFASIQGVLGVERQDNLFIISFEKDNDVRPAIFNYAVKNGLVIIGMQLITRDVAQIFQQLTKKQGDGSNL